MRDAIWKIRISMIEERDERSERACLVMEALADRRLVGGDGPWIVSYSAADASEACALCAEDLDAVEPRWIEVLDFAVIPALRRSPQGRSRWH